MLPKPAISGRQRAPARLVAAAIPVVLALSPPLHAEVLEAFGAVGDTAGEGRIVRVHEIPDSPEELLLTLTGNSSDIDIDLAGGKLYFADRDADVIKRSNLDGSALETIVSGLGQLSGMGLDLVNGKIYFGDESLSKIQRANLDGSTIEDVVSDVDWSQDIAVDAAGGKVYWADDVFATLVRADLDGMNKEGIVFREGQLIAGLALDTNAGKIYWSELLSGIHRANLDRSNREHVIEAFTNWTGPLDITEDKLYWADFTGLWRADLDGTNRDRVYRLDERAAYVAHDPVNRVLYWSELQTTGIRRREMPAFDTIASGLLTSAGMDIHTAGAPQIYYVETDLIGATMGVGAIHRANPDGSSHTSLLQNLTLPLDVLIDPDTAKMYWSDYQEGIQRADLDGSNVETIVADPAIHPFAIALEPQSQKIYWVNLDASTRRIMRADLTGLNVETVLSGVDNPRGLLIHHGLSKLYWTEYSGAGRGVHRANLDGSGEETLVASPDSPVGELQFDLSDGKMYWTEGSFSDHAVYRADLDGSNVEERPLLSPLTGDFLTLITTSAFVLHVDFNAGPQQDGTETKPFDSLQKALNRLANGGTILMNGASAVTDTSETPTMSRPMTLQAAGGPVRIGVGESAPRVSRPESGFVAPRD